MIAVDKQPLTWGYGADGRPVVSTFGNGLQAAVAGASGSGKSNTLKRFLLDACSKLGSALQLVILDAKRVEFMGWTPRAYVFTDQADFVPVIDGLIGEYERRKLAMTSNRWRISIDTPFILFVVDEISAVINAPEYMSAQRKALEMKLRGLSERMRATGMGAIWSGQTLSADVLPTSIRNNCTTRIVHQTMSEEALTMASGGRNEECRADLLPMPGMFFALTNTTRQRFVRGRSKLLLPDEESRLLAALAKDKRPLHCMDFGADDYYG